MPYQLHQECKPRRVHHYFFQVTQLESDHVNSYKDVTCAKWLIFTDSVHIYYFYFVLITVASCNAGIFLRVCMCIASILHYLESLGFSFKKHTFRFSFLSIPFQNKCYHEFCFNNNNTHITAIAPLPLTTHPRWWADLNALYLSDQTYHSGQTCHSG